MIPGSEKGIEVVFLKVEKPEEGCGDQGAHLLGFL